MKLLVRLALLVCVLLFFGAVLLYFLLPLIPPQTQTGPLHWIVELVVLLAAFGVGVLLNRPRTSGVRP